MEKLMSEEFDFFRREIFATIALLARADQIGAGFKLGNLYEVCRSNVVELRKREEGLKEE